MKGGLREDCGGQCSAYRSLGSILKDGFDGPRIDGRISNDIFPQPVESRLRSTVCLLMWRVGFAEVW
jgi:hypothetical protein